jgi:hypothetical protein
MNPAPPVTTTDLHEKSNGSASSLRDRCYTTPLYRMSQAGSSRGKPQLQRESYAFEPTPAVAASRSRSRFVNCPVCQEDHSQYLFHKVGVRFVRCAKCGMVYVSPLSKTAGLNWFDIDRTGQYSDPEDRALCVRDVEAQLGRLAADYERVEGRPLTNTVLIGRYLPEFGESGTARKIGLRIVTTPDDAFRDLVFQSSIAWAGDALGSDVQLLLLHEALEACSDAGAVVEEIAKALPSRAWIAVTYSNGHSLPARMLRRYWPNFFDFKSAFFNTSNLAALMARSGYVLTSQAPFVEHHTLEYLLDRIAAESQAAKALRKTTVSRVVVPTRTGVHVATFRRQASLVARAEKLSIIFPIYNEATFVGQVLEALLTKKLPIDKEVIVIESNSTDGSRAIVQKYAAHPEVKLILEDRPQGKGHAVRAGLAAATGTIILIQDADFEYDLDDYDALLEPILQHKATFVLGSRSLGLDDWKVRRFARGQVKGLALNFAQVLFARTFNVLFQKQTTDINTMFKVFRTECLQGITLEGDGFELDIELVCKLVRNGNTPMEVPVNYIARGFDEGKKIRFLRDAVPSYLAIFKHRFGGER